MENFNQEIFLFINSFAKINNFLDYLFIYLAEYSPYIFILIEIIVFFILKLKHEAIFAFYSMIIALGINKIIGLFYFHNRPFMDNIAVVLHEHKPDSSFPSDHTTFMLAITFSFLFYSKSNKLAKYLLFFAFIGGLSRVFIGVHYPFDIIGAAIVALLSATFIFSIKTPLGKINDFILRIETNIYNVFK